MTTRQPHSVRNDQRQHARSARRTVLRQGRRESGQITILIIGFAVIIGMSVTVVANASNAFLQRRALVSWADGAVTAAAQQVAPDALYGGQPVDSLPLSEAGARQAVADYVTRNELPGRFDEFRVVTVSVEPDAGRVTVELAAEVPFMLAGDVTAGLTSFTVTARSSAIVPFE